MPVQGARRRYVGRNWKEVQATLAKIAEIARKLTGYKWQEVPRYLDHHAINSSGDEIKGLRNRGQQKSCRGDACTYDACT